MYASEPLMKMYITTKNYINTRQLTKQEKIKHAGIHSQFPARATYLLGYIRMPVQAYMHILHTHS